MSSISITTEVGTFFKATSELVQRKVKGVRVGQQHGGENLDLEPWFNTLCLLLNTRTLRWLNTMFPDTLIWWNSLQYLDSMTPRFNETLIRLNISLGKLYEPTIIYKQYEVCLKLFSVAYEPVQIETKYRWLNHWLRLTSTLERRQGVPF